MAEIQHHWPDAAIQLVRSGGGVFEVSIDGDRVFSKRALGRHARPGEVIALLQQKIAP